MQGRPHLRLLFAVAVLAAAAALFVLFGRQSSGGTASGAVEFALGPRGDLHGLLLRAHGGPGASTLLILAGTPALTPNIDAALTSAGSHAPALLLLDTAVAADRAALRTLPPDVLAAALARTGSRRVALAGSGPAGTFALELAAAQPLRFCAVAARAPRLAGSDLPARERRRALFGSRILLVLAPSDLGADAFVHTLQGQDEQITLQPDTGSAAWPTQLLRFVAASCGLGPIPVGLRRGVRGGLS